MTIGTSVLGRRDGAEELADAMLSSPLGQLDTANVYAAGRSETTIGNALERRGGLPAGFAVFTKVDADPETGVFDADRVRRSFEESMGRLHLERVPLLHLHDPYTVDFDEALGAGGAVEGLLALKHEGLVDAIGIAAGDLDLVERYVRTGVFDAVLTHNRFTLVDQSAGPLLDLAAELGMTVFNAAPFGGGLLAGSTTRGRTYAYREAAPQLLRHLARVTRTCSDFDVGVGAAALHFSIADDRVSSTVVGVTSEARLRELERLAGTEIPDDLWPALEALGPPPAVNA